MNRNLVIVRAGDQSLHSGFLGDPQQRNWDIIVSYYDKNPDLYRDKGQRRIDQPGLQFAELHKLIGNLQDSGELDKYDYIWFPADDLVVNGPEAINAFFDIAQEFKLDLAQPSLTLDSIVGHAITIHNKAFRLRYTTFVESMAPCFSRAFLKRCWPSFLENKTGYGLDFLWCSWIEGFDKIAIVDAISVKHTRSKGPLYDLFKQHNVTPEQDMEDLAKKENIRRVKATLGGIDHQGQLHAVWNNGHQTLIKNLLAGYLPEFANHPDILFESFAPILSLMEKAS